jgi:FdrA protein
LLVALSGKWISGKMMVKKVVVEKDSYYDSVFLMLTSKAVKEMPGIRNAFVAMGTEMNMALLKELRLSTSEAEDATPNDLIIAVEGENEEVVEKACQSARELLRKKKRVADETGEYRPVNFETALNMAPDSNLTIISVPGMYAAREARKALGRGLHVMVFSDNVSLKDEIELKTLATEKGLLMMGPDCGTAIINGKPLCFANVVKRGDVGIVAASGTGLQELSCCIDKLGSGISQAIGTGGRDLKHSKVGGMTMLMGIEALRNDPDTKVIVAISKPPAEDVAARVISQLRTTGKPSVIHFIGLEAHEQSGNLWFADNLEETAGMAVALSKGEAYNPRTFIISEDRVQSIVKDETTRMSPRQKYLRGLYTGATLADEAMAIGERASFEIWSNIQTKPKLVLKDPHVSRGHTIVDLGDDVFTVGRPHPMIDPSIREERVHREMEDPAVALFLLDIILGYGSHEDPAGAMLNGLRLAKKRAEDRGGYLSIVASITGTEGDFQNMNDQKKKLESIGCVVMPSNFQASTLALKVIKDRAQED